MDIEDNRRGRLIAICGIDGSGKATQTDLLARRTEAAGHSVRHMSFPRYGEGFFADLVKRYLRGDFAPRAADVSPYLAALPYALDRWQAAPVLQQWLAEGRVAVCNRYVAANMAHQGSKLASEAEQRAFFEWIGRLEYGIFELPRPDLQILLDMPPALAVQLTKRRGSAAGTAPARDIHEDDIGHLEATAQAYRRIATEVSGAWAVINCAPNESLLSPTKISDAVWAEARRIL